MEVVETRSGSRTETQIQSVYKKLIASWNNRDANEYAGLFAEDADLIGFDGSQVKGRAEIKAHLNEIFNHHQTASYVCIIKEIRSLDPTVWVLRAVAGMIQPGKSEIEPSLNAIQTLVAVQKQDDFQIAVFQNTPAAFHGRPELSEKLTKELQLILHN